MVKTGNRGEKVGSTPNTIKMAQDLQLISRLRQAVDGKLLRGDIKGRDPLAKQT